jgi:hypothetical protein
MYGTESPATGADAPRKAAPAAILQLRGMLNCLGEKWTAYDLVS